MKLFPLLLIISVLIIFATCKSEEENYPIEPHIEFENIEFVDLPDKPGEITSDTINLTFSFTDGDSDFGLNDSYNKVPFQNRSYFRKVNGQVVASEDLKNGLINTSDLLRYADRSTPPYDTLPPFANDHPCKDWEIILKTVSDKSVPTDTLYFQSNINYYNLVADFQVSQPDGTYLSYKINECQSLNDRIDGKSGNYHFSKVKMQSQKKGTIIYGLYSSGFKLLFGGKKIKLGLYIKDRALHKSNLIESSEIIIPN